MSSCSSSTCTTCSTTSCTCCHVTNVAVDNQLCVGTETVLQTTSAAGGALRVRSCCPQTSGDLVTITGTPQQTAFKVVDGNVALGYTDATTAAFEPVVEVNTAGPDETGLSSDSRVRIYDPTQSEVDYAVTVDAGTVRVLDGDLVVQRTDGGSTEDVVAVDCSAQTVTVTGTGTGDTALMVTNGRVESEGGFVGDVMGNVAGNVLGDVEGNHFGELRLNDINVSAPATASESGNRGEVRFDSTYLYVCVDTDTWKRVALATW